MSYNYLPLDRKWLHFQQVKNLLDYNQQVSITFDAHERILKCREYVDQLSFENNASDEQNNLLKSHAVGTGSEVPIEIVKLMLMLKIKSLSYGHSGVHIDTVKRLMEMYNNNVFPVVFMQGLTASGNMSALSHISLPLIGLGEVFYNGQKRTSSEVLKELNWQPLQLKSKEAVALITGTQCISAYGMYALKKSAQLLQLADVIAALSFNAFDCSIEPLHEKINPVHHKGRHDTATAILQYLQRSESQVRKSEHVQMPYSFRCVPQIHGAAKDAFNYVLNVFLHEINFVTEDPVIYADDDLILNNASFNSQPLAIALDFLTIAISQLTTISERRIAHLMQLTTNQKGSSKQLAESQIGDAGFKSLQYTAAAIVCENKQLSIPASIDIVTVNSNEDYVSTAANAATKCLRLINNVEKVLAIELLIAAQAVKLNKPLHTSPFLNQVVEAFQQQVLLPEDMLMNEKMMKATQFVSSYKF